MERTLVLLKPDAVQRNLIGEIISRFEKVGMKIIFCETAGMHHKQAKKFFRHQNIIVKGMNPWIYANKLNNLSDKIGLPKVFDTFRQFQSEHYGGNRQWLRCIAQKIN